ncbi:MAG: enoyl-CoA hydratase/isomerase family protein [Flavobacteriales bacterium]|jgi:enoyl-CoA hydratase|tara:strand:+ start:3521 stop:4300 length:780 start_codon:yes stop_codon:yes gene_type:complete
MSYKNISLRNQDKISLLTIERPDNLNALNLETLSEINLALKSLEFNNSIRVIIITGSGNKAFVAGADIKEFSKYSKKEGEEMARSGHEKVFDYIDNYSKPVIAAINGYALGGGLELALSCHIRICAHNAKMGFPETTLGLIPGYGGTQRLPQVVGKGRALELILTGKMIDSNQALEMGLVSLVCEIEDLEDRCIDTAKTIINKSPFAQKQVISLVNLAFDQNKNGFESEIKAFGSCFQTSDFIEGTSAFIEKRKPKFNL